MLLARAARFIVLAAVCAAAAAQEMKREIIVDNCDQPGDHAGASAKWTPIARAAGLRRNKRGPSLIIFRG
jgi:hypothetical protein